jgi:hypothetical protein
MTRLGLFGLTAAASVCVVFALQQSPQDAKAQGVIYLNHSLNARMHPAPIAAVKLTEGFWAARRKTMIERELPSLLDLMEEHGIVDNFRRLSGKKIVPRRGRPTSDGDVYQWIEAASWALASPDVAIVEKQKIQAKLDPLISDVLSSQDATGYLDTFFLGDRAHLRFTDPLHSGEDYCLQHLIQAAIANYRATGDRRLLDGSIRFADYLLATFGPAKRPFVTGYPGLEAALVELFRTTGETKYLDFSRYLLSGVERDRLHLKDSETHYAFSGKPFTSHTEFEGHAIRALNAASGATDYLAESGDPAYKHALDLLWSDLTLRKMSITGGVATQPGGELFGAAYEIPGNSSEESCAAVASVMWSFRMLALTGDARYSDVLERTLYNAALSGGSVANNLSCYRNSLAANAERVRGANPDADCCPLSVESLTQSLPGYFYATSRDGLYVNLYNASELNWHLEDGVGLKVVQTTDYPWSGEVKFTLFPARPSQFAFHLRWPAWADSADVFINGNRATGEFERGAYISLTRTWQSGDTVVLDLPFQTIPMRANPRIGSLYGKMAVERGPLVYAIERAEQAGASISDLFIRGSGPGIAEFHKELLGGVTVIKYPGFVAERSLAEQPLYESAAAGYTRNRRPIALTLIPYFGCANRETGSPAVWIPAIRAPENQPIGWANHGSDRHQMSQ